MALVMVAIEVHDADRPVDDVDAVLVGRADRPGRPSCRRRP